MEQAPFACGYYEGLAAIGNDALAFFSVAGLPGNSADIHAVRATP